jgi:hypothetical protein
MDLHNQMSGIYISLPSELSEKNLAIVETPHIVKKPLMSQSRTAHLDQVRAVVAAKLYHQTRKEVHPNKINSSMRQLGFPTA